MIQKLSKLHEHVRVDVVGGIGAHHDVSADNARTRQPRHIAFAVSVPGPTGISTTFLDEKAQ